MPNGNILGLLLPLVSGQAQQTPPVTQPTTEEERARREQERFREELREAILAAGAPEEVPEPVGRGRKIAAALLDALSAFAAARAPFGGLPVTRGVADIGEQERLRQQIITENERRQREAQRQAAIFGAQTGLKTAEERERELRQIRLAEGRELSQAERQRERELERLERERRLETSDILASADLARERFDLTTETGRFEARRAAARVFRQRDIEKQQTKPLGDFELKQRAEARALANSFIDGLIDLKGKQQIIPAADRLAAGETREQILEEYAREIEGLPLTDVARQLMVAEFALKLAAIPTPIIEAEPIIGVTPLEVTPELVRLREAEEAMAFRGPTGRR